MYDSIVITARAHKSFLYVSFSRMEKVFRLSFRQNIHDDSALLMQSRHRISNTNAEDPSLWHAVSSQSLEKLHTPWNIESKSKKFNTLGCRRVQDSFCGIILSVNIQHPVFFYKRNRSFYSSGSSIDKYTIMGVGEFNAVRSPL